MARSASVHFGEIVETVRQLRRQGRREITTYALRAALGNRGSHGYLKAMIEKISADELSGKTLEELLLERPTIEVTEESAALDRLRDLASQMAEKLEPLAVQLMVDADKRAELLQPKVDELTKANETLLHLVEEKDRINGHLKAEVENAQLRCDAQAATLSEAEKTKATLQRNIGELEAQKQVLTERAEQLRERIERDRESSKLAREAIVLEHREALHTSTERAIAAENRAGEQQGVANRLHGEIATLNQRNGELIGHQRSLQAELQQTRAELTQLESKHALQLAETDAVRQALVAEREENAKHRTSRAHTAITHAAQLESLQAQLDSALTSLIEQRTGFLNEIAAMREAFTNRPAVVPVETGKSAEK